MSEAMDVMLKIGITERRIRNPHCTQAAQQCKLMACPRTAQRTEAYRPSVHFSGRPSAALDHPQEPATLFLPVQSASHLSFSFALIVQLRTYRSRPRSREPLAAPKHGRISNVPHTYDRRSIGSHALSRRVRAAQIRIDHRRCGVGVDICRAADLDRGGAERHRGAWAEARQTNSI